jgi:DNA replication initiation complex subunit (GINS family)
MIVGRAWAEICRSSELTATHRPLLEDVVEVLDDAAEVACRPPIDVSP